MLNKFVFFISFLIISNWTSAQLLQKNNWYDFEGQISGKPVILSVYIFENQEVKGNYFYKEENTKIQFNGTLSGNNIHLSDPKKNTFTLEIADNSPSDDETDLKGQFFEAENNTKSELNFLLKNYSEGSFEHRYSRFEASDEEVEKFAEDVSNAILSDDKTWLKNNCYYPLMVEFENSVFGSIVNKEQFVKQYSVFVTNEMKNNIKNARTLNMEYDAFAGAIIGKYSYKYITINEFPDLITKKLKLIISSITHY